MQIQETQKPRDPIIRKKRMSRFNTNEAILKNLLDNVVPVPYREEIYADFRDHALEFDFWEMNFVSDKDMFRITCLAREATQGLLKPKFRTITITFNYSELKSFVREELAVGTNA